MTAPLSKPIIKNQSAADYTATLPHQKMLYISVAQLLSSIAVVALHVNTFWNFGKEPRWIFANFIECFCYPAVPIFFMITGITLLDYRTRYNTKTYARKRIQRTLIPFLFWSAIITLSDLAVGHADPSLYQPRAFIGSILTTSQVGVYWFFIPLFSLYMLIPLLSLIPSQKRLKPFFISSLIAVLLSCANILFPLLGIAFPSELTFGLFSYAIFLLLGYWAAHTPLTKKQRILIYVLGILGFCVHFFGTWIFSYAAGDIAETFKGYTAFPCIMHSLALFIFIKQVNWENLSPKIRTFVSRLSSLTFGVYLFHAWILENFNRYLPSIAAPTRYKPLMLIAVFVLSASITALFKKLPILRKLC